MSDLPRIVHVVDSRLEPGRQHALQALLQRESRPDHHSILSIGDLPNFVSPVGITVRSVRPSPLRFMFRNNTLRSIFPPTDRLIVHIWSPVAAAFLIPLLRPASCQAIDLVVECDPRILAKSELSTGWLRQLRAVFVANCAREAATLSARGFQRDLCAVIRPGVDFGLMNQADHAALREKLKLSPNEKAVLILPPAEEATGVRFAAWSTLLAERALPSIRMLLAGNGTQVQRALRLSVATDRRRIVRDTHDDYSLAELLVASDVAVYVPENDAPCGCLAWAMAARRPILASAVPCTTELLAHGHNAWLCRPADPRDGAKRLLEILDAPAEGDIRTRVAHSQAFAVFSQQRMLEQYEALYRNIAAGSAPASGISDAATL